MEEFDEIYLSEQEKGVAVAQKPPKQCCLLRCVRRAASHCCWCLLKGIIRCLPCGACLCCCCS